MGDMLDLSRLLSTYTIKGVTLRNRFVMPAMQRGWCEAGRPSSKMADYYRRRSAAGVGLIIGESGAVDHPSSSFGGGAAHVYGRALDGWAECIAAVKAEGGHMLLQLWHEGAVRRPSEDAYPSLSPSGLVQNGKPNGRAATAEELEEIKAAFVRSARAAQQIGAVGVEIHAAHGYGLDLFLWEETNHRSDRYGGDHIGARLRFPAEIVAAVRAATGPDFLISFRFSQWKEVDLTARIVRTPDELGVLLAALRNAGADIFHPSTRRFYTPEWEDSPLGLSGWCKKFTDAPVVAVGSVGLDTDIVSNLFGNAEAKSSGVGGLRELSRRFENHEFDLVAVGRSLIADPDWIQKIAAGRYDALKVFTKEALFGGIEWDMSFVAEAHGLEADGAMFAGKK